MLNETKYKTLLYQWVDEAYEGAFSDRMFYSHHARKRLYNFIQNPTLIFSKSWIENKVIPLFKNQRIALKVMGANLFSFWIERFKEDVPNDWVKCHLLPLLKDMYRYLSLDRYLSLIAFLQQWLEANAGGLDMNEVNYHLLPILQDSKSESFLKPLIYIYVDFVVPCHIVPTILLASTILYINKPSCW